MVVRKFRVYSMRKGERHYECVGERLVSLSDNGHDAWLDLNGTEIHGTVATDKALAPASSLRGAIRDLYLHER